MRAFISRAAFAALLFLPASARAQTLSLTEADALARLSMESPRVRAIRSAVELARADVLAASRWPNPRVIVDREAVAGTTEYITSVGQLLPVNGQRGFQIRAASAMVDASASRADEEVRRVRADLRIAFAQLAAAQIRERELTAARDRLRELADILTKREAAGDAAGFDRLRAEREVLDLDADRAVAAIDRARAQAMLAGFFVEQIDPSRLVAAATAPSPIALPDIEALVARAGSTRGELRALRQEVDAARWSARAADRRRIPDPEIVAGTKSSSIGAGDVGSVLMAQAVIPLFDRGRAERALADARGTQAEARAAAFLATMRTEIGALRTAVIERREAAARYRAAAVNSAAQIERIAQVSYDAGERGILELLDAYRTGSTARVRQAALDAAARQAEIELEYVSGWEIP
jgi:cobalt-zinc-cadmium efflux system outer membrane protein